MDVKWYSQKLFSLYPDFQIRDVIFNKVGFPLGGIFKPEENFSFGFELLSKKDKEKFHPCLHFRISTDGVRSVRGLDACMGAWSPRYIQLYSWSLPCFECFSPCSPVFIPSYNQSFTGSQIELGLCSVCQPDTCKLGDEVIKLNWTELNWTELNSSLFACVSFG